MRVCVFVCVRVPQRHHVIHNELRLLGVEGDDFELRLIVHNRTQLVHEELGG